jgi:hypothetical protein
MDQKRIWKQMVGLNKAAFDSMFSTMALMQDQIQMMGNLFIEQVEWIPNEGKKVTDEWVSVCRKGREHFKRAMDEGFAKAESFLARS